MRESDIKVLWGRSGNRCAICRCELTMGPDHTRQVPLGEQAHIAAKTTDGPRGESALKTEERDQYHNLILLCPSDHSRIDKLVDSYPVERLHQIKTDHELWVQSSLALTPDVTRHEAYSFLYAHLVDSAVEACDLKHWKAWTSHALGLAASWDRKRLDSLRGFRHQMLRAIKPGHFVELERSLDTLAITCHQAVELFLRHAEKQEGRLYARQFYKDLREWDTEKHERLFRKWECWVETCELWLFAATKAANWMADVVRRDINPYFFLTDGKFVVERGPLMDLSWETMLLEFTDDEKASLPDGWRGLVVGEDA